MINKNKWRGIADERAVIDSKKVKYFMNVFNSLIAHYGSIRVAVERAGIGQSSYYKMVNHNELSVCVGHRIMDAFTEIAPYYRNKKI